MGFTTCHAVGCSERIPRNMLMCKPHWFKVPKPLRDEIWRTYKAGETSNWLKVVKEAQRVVQEKERDSHPT